MSREIGHGSFQRRVAIMVGAGHVPGINAVILGAALAAGNTVILKPASDTVLVAHRLCECFWKAGVSRKALQLIPCSGGTGGKRLVSHDHVDVVIPNAGEMIADVHYRGTSMEASAVWFFATAGGQEQNMFGYFGKMFQNEK